MVQISKLAVCVLLITGLMFVQLQPSQLMYDCIFSWRPFAPNPHENFESHLFNVLLQTECHNSDFSYFVLPQPRPPMDSSLLTNYLALPPAPSQNGFEHKLGQIWKKKWSQSTENWYIAALDGIFYESEKKIEKKYWEHFFFKFFFEKKIWIFFLKKCSEIFFQLFFSDS